MFEHYNRSIRTELYKGYLRLGDVVYVNFNNNHDYVIDSESRVFDCKYPPAKEFFRFFDANIASTFISKNKTPYMIITVDGDFTHLDNIKLNTTSLDIYLWETPTLSDSVSLESNSITDTYKIHNISNLSELGGYKENTKTHCIELKAIDRFIKNNNLTNVTIHTGLYKFGNKTKDINLSAQCNATDKMPSMCQYNINEKFDNQIHSKFICFNKRYDVFRELVAAHLLDKDCQLSFYPRNTDINIEIDNNIVELKKYKPYWKNLNLRVWEDIDQLLVKFPNLENNIDQLNKKNHVIDSIQYNDINYADEQPLPVVEIKSAFCTVVNECTFAWPYAHLSEKILMPVKVFRPFLLFAPAYSLEYFKKLGFKTFSKWFDESYDNATNHVERMSKLMTEINKVNNYTYNQCKTILDDMQDVLEHNFNNLQYLLKQKGI